MVLAQWPVGIACVHLVIWNPFCFVWGRCDNRAPV